MWIIAIILLGILLYSNYQKQEICCSLYQATGSPERYELISRNECICPAVLSGGVCGQIVDVSYCK